jgi:glycosyltransferase involved in cell wall biosynthesis
MQGGVGDCTHELGSALMQLGHQVAVVTSSQVVRSVADQSERVEPSVHPVVPRWNWGSWGCVLDKVRALQSEILHIQYQTAGYGMHPAINLLPWRVHRMERHPRVVVTFHDLRVPYLFPKAGAVREWVTLALARWSDAVIATNAEDLRSLRTWSPGHRYSVPPLWGSSLHWIPIGSNIHPQAPPEYDRMAWRRSLGVNEDEILLGYFGFLNESKGGETLFRCLAELVRRGQQVKLLMIGGQVGDSDPTNVAYAQRVRTLGTELGVDDLVLWTGYTPAEQVSANFLAADICVLPYRDGASYRRGSLMAALAHGLPIVSTRSRASVSAAGEWRTPPLGLRPPGRTAFGPRGLARQGETGDDTLIHEENILLVPADDPLVLADAVERLISTPELRARLARGALKLAKAFTWDGIASRTAQVYAEILRAPEVRAAQHDSRSPRGEKTQRGGERVGE